MTDLETLIRAEIVRTGPIRFDQFMEMALYHERHGYYRRERTSPQTGREGDYFTSVSVGPLFGRLLARQFFQMWQVLGRPATFWLMEQGAHDGELACDILAWCRDEVPDFFATVRYAIVEPSAVMRRRQQKLLARGGFSGQLAWAETVDALGPQKPVGVFFSNELVDAFPVRVIRFHSGQWWERLVTVGDESLDWSEAAITDTELQQAVAALPQREGYLTEINLASRRWMEKLGANLLRGYAVTLDYGFPASVYYADFRSQGTLSAYAGHQRTENVLAEPGGRDITAHVDFTALADAGGKGRLTTLGFLDQQRFLMGIAHDELSEASGPRVALAENVRAWQTLTHPDFLGTRFHALVQAKDAPVTLDCLRFARPGGLD